MKRNYVMMAMAAAMLASCAQTGLVEEIAEEPQKAIGFSTFVDKATRAENSEHSDYSLALNDHHDNFKVWGYKSVQNDYIFTGKEVRYSSSKWGYTGLVYWDKAATSYEFYAAAPATANWTLNKNVEATQNDDYFTISSNYTVTAHNISNTSLTNSFKGTTNAVDLMIADKKKVENAQFGSTVQLDFTHILSRLNITVSKDETMSGQTVILKSLNLYNVNHQGTFDESKATGTTLSVGTNARWTTNNDVTTYSALTDQELKYISSVTPLPSGATATAEYMLQSLIMPQLAGVETVKLDGTSPGLQEPYFTIVYTITDNGNTEEFSASYNLASTFGVTSGNTLAFNEGWQNTLNITIKPSAIAFTGNVAVWGAGPVSNPIIQ